MERSTTASADGMPLAERVKLAQLPPPHVRRSTRLAARATLRDLAKELGVTPMTVLRWEAGTVTPRLEHASAYRNLLDALAEAVR